MAAHSYPTTDFLWGLVLRDWAAMASIAWLGSWEVSTTELTGPWNTKRYGLTGGDTPQTRHR